MPQRLPSDRDESDEHEESGDEESDADAATGTL